MKKNLPVTNKEIDYPDTIHIASSTDLKGAITSYNQDFLDVSGFSGEELMGKNHNIVRHPDMPPEGFADLWDNLKKGNSWMGIVKNRAKNGDHYWVDAYVTPMCVDGKVVGYQSVRTKPDRAVVKRAEALYKAINNKSKNYSGKLLGVLTGSVFKRVFLASLLALIVPVGMVYMLGGAMMAAGAAVVGGGISALLSFLIARPFKKVARDAANLFSNDLACYVYTGRNDELGQIQLTLKSMAGRINTILWTIDGAVANLEEIASVTSNAMRSTDSDIREQQLEIDQVVTAMNEMAATVQEVANNTSQGATASQEANALSSEGALAATNALTALMNLVSRVQESAQAIERVESQSDHIGTVLEVIQGIADQTNLLALNAAIEAARAGEQGRGFAVVADEVRTLASRTHESTQEINSMIEGFQSETQKTVAIMKTAQEGADRSMEDVEQLAESLALISGSVQTIQDMSTHIATAAEEQSSVAEEVNRNIVNIGSLADKTTHISEQAAEQMRKLVKQSRELHDLVRRFSH